MSALSDAIDAVDVALDAEITRNAAVIAANTAEIARLQALVDAGTATQADMDKLAAIKVKLDQANAASPVVAPT